MLRKYPNALIEQLRDSGWDATEFNITRGKERFPVASSERQDWFSLKFRDTPLLFEFRADPGEMFVYQYLFYSAENRGGLPLPRFPLGRSIVPMPFGGLKREFVNWLGSIELYLSDQKTIAENRATPDLWSELSLPDGDKGELAQNAPFNREEQDRIAVSLRNFQRQVKEAGLLPPDQMNRLEQKVDLLIADARRPGLGRRDWLATIAGALVSFVIEAGLRSDLARRVWQMAGEALRWVAGGPFLIA